MLSHLQTEQFGPDIKFTAGHTDCAGQEPYAMADSRLAVQEKEYQRREAYSDFFPSISLQYGATLDRYWSLSNIMGLYGMQDSRYATGQEAYRRGNNGIPSATGVVSIPHRSVSSVRRVGYNYTTDIQWGKINK